MDGGGGPVAAAAALVAAKVALRTDELVEADDVDNAALWRRRSPTLEGGTNSPRSPAAAISTLSVRNEVCAAVPPL